jgi:hypothetical protein
MQAYNDTFVSLGDTLDNLFYMLDGRIQTSKVFSAYLLEFDVLGHMQTAGDVGRAFGLLAHRMEQFRAKHPERKIHFTILSDHGMDFIRVNQDRLTKMSDELEKAGVKSVTSLNDHDPTRELFAIPIMHTRVTYVALHTHPSIVDEVAGRVANRPSVDLAIARAKAPETASPATQIPAPAGTQWFNVWADGKAAVRFGFDAVKDEYYLPAGQDYARVDVPLDAQDFMDDNGQPVAYKVMGDDALFALIKHHRYPDIFYRTRSALSPVGLEYPADVIVSFKPTYASMGFQLPGKGDIATSGFHGAMEELGTLGTLLTTEKEIPDAVRSDTFLEMFPLMRQNMKKLGVSYVEGDPNASLHY